jgi:hypothetical protein
VEGEAGGEGSLSLGQDEDEEGGDEGESELSLESEQAEEGDGEEGVELEGSSGTEDEDEGGLSDSDSEHYRARKRRRTGKAEPTPRAQAAPAAESLATLKKRLADATALPAAAAGDAAAAGSGEGGVPDDWGRILSQQDFDAIRQLRHKKMVEAAMQKHGLKSASKQARIREKVEEEAEEMLQLKVRKEFVSTMAPWSRWCRGCVSAPVCARARHALLSRVLKLFSAASLSRRSAWAWSTKRGWIRLRCWAAATPSATRPNAWRPRWRVSSCRTPFNCTRCACCGRGNSPCNSAQRG